MSSHAGSSPTRPSDSTDKAGDTDDSFTSTDSADQAASNATNLIQLVGSLSDQAYLRQRKQFRGTESPNPHLKELAKLRLYPEHEELEWEKANEKHKKQEDVPHHQTPTSFSQAQFTQLTPTEKVGRVWIPSDPNENPNISSNTHIQTKHNKFTEQIVRLIQDQIEMTRAVFEIVRSCAKDRFRSIADVEDGALKYEREAHAVLALRLQGVEVCEWVEDAERWEVYFEDPEDKME